MKKVVLFSALILVFVLSSCTKDLTVEQETTQNSTTSKPLPHKYKIDGKEVSSEDFYDRLLDGKTSFRTESANLEQIASRYHVVFEFERPEPSGVYDVTNAFTAQQPYYDYAHSAGYNNVEDVENALQDLAAYAQTSGAMEEVERTGVIPLHYMDYMNNYLRQHNLPLADGGLQTRTLTNYAYKACWLNKNDEISAPIMRNPWLGSINFNNNISSYLPVGFLGGSSSVFDGNFYTRRLGTIWSWGLDPTDFCTSERWSYMNDRASSWWSL